MEKNFHFFNIAIFSPGHEKQLAQDLIDYQARTGNDLALYSLTLHPEGRPAMDKVLFMLGSYRKLKAELAGSKVRLGILLQAILGHWPRVDKNEEPWTRSVNIDGKAVRYCPLDPRFQNYITQTITLLAREQPAFILSDDDVRSFSHRPECFCQLHTDLFNRRFGTHFTPDDYRKAVANSTVGDDVFNHYDIVRREMVNGVVDLIRKAIDAVDPDIPSGTCMPGEEYRFNGETARHMAGPNHPAVMRICNSNYLEGSPKIFPEIIAKTQALRQAHLDIPIVLDEADTFPHNLWSRSATGMHAKLCSSIMSGLKGAKLWFVNCHKRGFPVNRNYTDILTQNQGLYQTLAAEVEKTSMGGVIIPAHRTFDKWHPNGNLQFFIEPDTWANVLGRYGIPFHVSFDYDRPAVYAIAGAESARRFTDDELKHILAQRVLLDGPATAVLSQRGYDHLLGVHAEHRDFRFNGEAFDAIDQPLGLSKSPYSPYLTLVDPEHAEVLTHLQYSPFYGSPAVETVAPGTVIYANAAGGTVCTTAFHLNTSYDLWGESRKFWLITCLEKLLGNSTPTYLENPQDMTLLARHYQDGQSLLAIFNLNADPAPAIQLRSDCRPMSVEHLNGDGTWSPAPFTLNGNLLTVNQPLHYYQCLILRIK